MFKPEEGALTGVREDGVAGNGRLAGAGPRLAAIAAALAIGVGLALLSFSAAGSWG